MSSSPPVSEYRRGKLQFRKNIVAEDWNQPFPSKWETCETYHCILQCFLFWERIPVRSLGKINKCACFHIAEILTLFLSYQNMSNSSEPNENSTHQKQITFINEEKWLKILSLSAWWKYTDHFIFQKAETSSGCKYCQKVFSISISCVINSIFFFLKYRGTLVVVHPEEGNGLYTCKYIMLREWKPWTRQSIL